eukprot:2387859-Pleurochrysis_carterae.AAC.8
MPPAATISLGSDFAPIAHVSHCASATSAASARVAANASDAVRCLSSPLLQLCPHLLACLRSVSWTGTRRSAASSARAVVRVAEAASLECASMTRQLPMLPSLLPNAIAPSAYQLLTSATALVLSKAA